MTSNHSAWMPAQGRHRVNIGSSLKRALKARKGIAATRRSNLPDRDFYSFRYNFKPSSIDSTKPGTIDVRGKDSTGVTVEHPSQQGGEGHVFVGQEHPAKETDCVLIYDEETGTFTLEKLDSHMVLKYEPRTATNTTRSFTTSHPTTLSTSQGSSQDLDLEAQLEKDLLEIEDDADGEPDEVMLTLDTAALREEEEEEEEEETVPLPPPTYKPARPTKPSASSSRQPDAVPAVRSKSAGTSRQREKVEVISDAEEEDLEFGQPTRKRKRARTTPPIESLALPGPSSAVHVPHASYPPSFTPAHMSSAIQPTPPAPPATSDSEEDWEPVPPAPVALAEAEDGEEEEEEEIDMSEFEEEMKHHLGGSAGSPEPEVIAPPSPRQPMSLNEFAGGEVEASQDDDDYTSSEESDDD